MNMRTPDIMFRSNRHAEEVQSIDGLTEPVVEAAVDVEIGSDLTEASMEVAEQAADRLLVSSKTPDMTDLVCRALGQQNHLEVDVASYSPVELASDRNVHVADYSIVVLEIDPDDAVEMDALHDLCARAPESTRFLAVTAEALTLAVARQLMDAGVDEVLPLTSIRPDQNREQQAEQPSTVQSEPAIVHEHDGIVVAIAQTRGGIGATTLALNLASMLSEPKSRRDKTPVAKVALLDLDFQNGDAAASIDIDDNGALMEMLKSGKAPDAAFLRAALTTYDERFDVLPNPVEFAPFDAMTPEMMAQTMIELRRMYDYVLVSMPRAMVRWIEPVLARVDQFLLVTDTSVTGIRQARRLIDFYTEDNPGMPLEVVISKEKRPMTLPKSIKEAASFLDRPLDTWLPRDDKSARKATDQGMPLVACAKRSTMVKPLRKIVDRLQVIQASEKRRDA